ncbi:MAG: Glu/Leu/Phe/Val dehydrogenase [Phycisphaeraceae bacterium]|nr:Glu/Leu/Phe/Val dehydrogenase [Phycisphaeraceae bacterium]MCB9848062.1 Glu/Leu/Phe/Val dehydrogenase [Phycisphaeraceae bacterium]
MTTTSTTPIHALGVRASWARQATRLAGGSQSRDTDGAKPMVFQDIQNKGHENVLYCFDKATGLRAIIAVHDTTLGSALGGMRRWCYASEQDMLYDVLRLAEGMTYKAAAADLPMGGAKTVIWKPEPDTPATEAEARAMAAFVDRLGGLYIAAEDVGVNMQYIDWMLPVTSHVMGGTAPEQGGDPSPYTAAGVVNGMRACVRHAGLGDTFKNLTIAIQGLGAVGWKVAQAVHDEGGRLLVADIRQEILDKAKARFGATIVSDRDIVTAECDIFCPCALGAVIGNGNIDTLRTRIIAGGANNVLIDPIEDGALLRNKGVIYAPDFVINGGGLIRLAGLYCGFTPEDIDRRVANIEHAVFEILETAGSGTTHDAAIRYAKKRLDAGHPLTPSSQ